MCCSNFTILCCSFLAWTSALSVRPQTMYAPFSLSVDRTKALTEKQEMQKELYHDTLHKHAKVRFPLNSALAQCPRNLSIPTAEVFTSSWCLQVWALVVYFLHKRHGYSNLHHIPCIVLGSVIWDSGFGKAVFHQGVWCPLLPLWICALMLRKRKKSINLI